MGTPSLAYKDPVTVAATTNVNTVYAPNVVDGHTLNAGDRVLLTAQTAPTGLFSPFNGIYAVLTPGTGSNGLWQRAPDFSSSSDIMCGLRTYVQWGAINAKSTFVLTSPGTLTLGVTGLRFERDSTPVYGGTINLVAGQDYITVTGSAVPFPPSDVLFSYHKTGPSGMLWTATVRGPITSDGFTADLTFLPPDNTYILGYRYVR